MAAWNQAPCASSSCEAGDSGGFPAATGAKIVQASGRGRSRVYTERSSREYERILPVESNNVDALSSAIERAAGYVDLQLTQPTAVQGRANESV